MQTLSGRSVPARISPLLLRSRREEKASPTPAIARTYIMTAEGETVSNRDTADDRCSPRRLRLLPPTPLAERLYIATRRRRYPAPGLAFLFLAIDLTPHPEFPLRTFLPIISYPKKI
ncbi:hypothetical protein J6590_075436 [Homalodisca vitripennis]|nr:hypothetical protein J6590_075436 [Homalodisca vitripennis]